MNPGTPEPLNQRFRGSLFLKAGAPGYDTVLGVQGATPPAGGLGPALSAVEGVSPNTTLGGRESAGGGRCGPPAGKRKFAKLVPP